MRLVIDMQGAQTASRFRGIGRYTMALSKAMAESRGEHEIILALNAAYPDTIEPIRATFTHLLPTENIRVWEALGSVGGHNVANDARRKATEAMREAFLASLEPDIILVSSMFEEYGGEAVTSVGTLTSTLPTAVILYDLIPLIHRDVYLRDAGMSRWYYGKIDHLRRADLLLAISESSGQEGKEFLDYPECAITNISTAGDAHFLPRQLHAADHARLTQIFGIERPFVLYAGGDDLRKNVDGLIRAYASLPTALRAQHQLVLAGWELFDQRAHYLALGRKTGLVGNELLLTGQVTETDLVLLYNACTLFVFPSWHEGFGLPVLEAMACGKAAIAANSSSLPEVVGRADALFAPCDDVAMATKMGEVLGNPEFRQELERHGLAQAKKFSWETSAACAWGALEKLHQQKKQERCAWQMLPKRPRLAFVSPLPPEKTGIADYAGELLPELARHYDITVIVQQAQVVDTKVQAYVPIQDVAWFHSHAQQFERVVYQFGNSAFHSHMFAMLAEHPGVVVLHDFFLSGVLGWNMEPLGIRPYALLRALHKSHGWTAVHARFQERSADNVIWSYPCNLDILQQALGVITHSEFSRRLARQWYLGAAKDWAVIPHLRAKVFNIDKTAARIVLGLMQKHFIVCSFGGLGPMKLNHCLLDAWLASPLAEDQQCRLVFVGENDGGDYGRDILRKIAQSPAKDRIIITGWVSGETYRTWLVAADVGVQLRNQSRGETSGTVLDCMNYGLPTIINAHGSMAELPCDVVWMLPDEFSDDQLAEALSRLRQDDARRADLGALALAQIRTMHNPHRCAEQYALAIEAFYANAEKGLNGLTQALPWLTPPLSPNEYSSLASTLAANFPPFPRKPQFLLDVSELVYIDLGTGIQRVTRALLREISANLSEGWIVEPVYATVDRPGYRYARKFMSRFLGIPDDWAEDAPVQTWQGDIFLGLDLQPQAVLAQQGVLEGWRSRGVAVHFMVYDLLPVMMPEVFPEGAQWGHQQWLSAISRFDGAICISQSVADELQDWLQTFGAKRESPYTLNWFHLGSDTENSAPSLGMPSDAPETLNTFKVRPTFLMIGTIEPRKGYLQTLHAFNQLWQQGIDVNLILVGKEGWKPLPDDQRRDIPQTVQALRTHPELGKRLYWLEGISDEYLEQVYAASTCLIAASYGEGFGLPLIEAARHGLPLLVRDIPVFREVTAGHAQFFPDTRKPKDIAQAVSDWLGFYQKGEHLRSETVPHLTWTESARNAFDIVLGNTAPYRTWLPDGVRRYWGADPRLRSEVGRVQGRAIQTTGKLGYLIYGPDEIFEPGRYRAVICLKAENWVGDEWLDISTDLGQKKIFHRALEEHRKGVHNEMFAFNLQERKFLEIRLWVAAGTQLYIDSIEINKLDGHYDNEFAVMVKSYAMDLKWAVALYCSWLKNATRQSPFYIIVPRKDVFVLHQHLDDTIIDEKKHPTVLAEEDVLDVAQMDCLENFTGWHIQQVIKLCFSKVGMARDYLTLDSAMIFTKPFDYLDLYAADGVFCTAAQPVKKIDFYGAYQKEGTEGWLNGELVCLSQSLEAICRVMGNETEDTHWYIATNGFFNSELCERLDDFATEKGLNGFVGLINFAPYEFAWYGEYVYMLHRDKFRPKWPLIMQPCIDLLNLRDMESGYLRVSDGFYGWLFQPPASEHFESIIKLIDQED